MLADAGSGQMALDMQGKQILDPQFQFRVEIFPGRFDLPLKASDFPVMQEKAPFFCGFINDVAVLTYHKSGAFSILLTTF